METLTVWQKGSIIEIVQLSDDEDDGTVDAQIAHLERLDFLAGYICVSRNYLGAFPNSDESAWLWVDGSIVTKQPTLAETSKEFERAIQAELDADARAKGYDNIDTASAYAGAPNPFQEESKLFITRRGNVWAYCFNELGKVKAGTRPMPTIAQIISELPARVSA